MKSRFDPSGSLVGWVEWNETQPNSITHSLYKPPPQLI